MESVAKLISAFSGLAWPALLIFVGYYFRNQIRDIFNLIRQQMVAGGSLKWKEFEFKGADLASFDSKEGRTFLRKPADEPIFDKRHESYAKNKNLFLVHRSRPTGRLHQVTQLPTFDISVYLVPHKNFGRLNDVREVEYYFGQHFGLVEGKFGTKYVVANGSEGFAVRINAYGPTLCEARIVFHDGSEATVSRYLDFEGTGYQFREVTNQADLKKIQFRKEETEIETDRQPLKVEKR
jgi:hypothetical protein